MYTEFVEGLLSIFSSSAESDETDSEDAQATEVSPDLLQFFKKITPQLMIWASNDVVVKWSRFRRGGDKHPPMEYMFMMEELLTAIRKDLGHSGAITKGDLLGLYVNDIDEHLPSKK
ncbi:MAG: hypothetical protein JWN68_3299 [Nocardioides sp.]|jgi:hypothetical protein|uniref:hypothetical protein n=1 Tax=Nocardioides sp. TaxID=35761 RepID=UPI0026324B4A|nr:hypothetical protein [Nocardioides sp.]MCW2835346.1 hypothetical protein [Nocardioides sp.]